MTWYMRSDQSTRLGATRYNLDKSDNTAQAGVSGIEGYPAYFGYTQSRLYTVTSTGTMTLRASTTGGTFSVASQIAVPANGGVVVGAAAGLSLVGQGAEVYAHTTAQPNSVIQAGSLAVAIPFTFDDDGENYGWVTSYFGGGLATAADGICVAQGGVTYKPYYYQLLYGR